MGGAPRDPGLTHRGCGNHSAFRGAVVIDHVEGKPSGWSVVQHISTGEQKTQCRRGRPFHRHHGRGMDGRNEGDRYSLANHPLLHQVRRRAHCVICKAHGRARGKIRPKFPDRRIKSKTGKMTRAISSRHVKGFLVPTSEMSEIGMRNLNPFGNASRPRGVDHVGKAFRWDGFAELQEERQRSPRHHGKDQYPALSLAVDPEVRLGPPEPLLPSLSQRSANAHPATRNRAAHMQRQPA